MAKLMVSIGDENFRLLSLEARQRGITMQELIRAVIVPDWVRFSNAQRVEDDRRVQSVPLVTADSPIPSVYSHSRR
jgi:hypothetical protein